MVITLRKIIFHFISIYVIFLGKAHNWGKWWRPSANLRLESTRRYVKGMSIEHDPHQDKQGAYKMRWIYHIVSQHQSCLRVRDKDAARILTLNSEGREPTPSAVGEGNEDRGQEDAIAMYTRETL